MARPARAPQPSLRQRHPGFVNHSALQSTLREIRALAGNRRAWAVLAVLCLVVGLVGPFGTFTLPLPLRLTYWTAVVVFTALMGTLVASFIERLIGARLPRLVGAALAGCLAGLPVALTVMAIDAAAFGAWLQPLDLASLTLYCMLISAAVTMLSAVLETGDAPAAATVTAPAAPPLLERLPLPQRGRLLHLSVADHYVEVTTDKGKALLLMRLSDAIRETAPVPGLQVHRSHWIALDAVRRAARQSGKPVLELENGTTVPISRSFLDAARQAGLVS